MTNAYKLIIDPGTSGGLKWEYDFRMSSDAMATDYATRIVRTQLADIPWLAGVTLFNMTKGAFVTYLTPIRHVAVMARKQEDVA